jgi:arginase family enzyme
MSEKLEVNFENEIIMIRIHLFYLSSLTSYDIHYLLTAYDATVIGVPFDGGCTYRTGTRFGPQGIRRISALYTPYNYEMGVDLREQMTLCDAGDVFTIPANIEKSFDQVNTGIDDDSVLIIFIICQSSI